MNTVRNARMIGLFSGFPEHHFTDAHVEVLRENLPKRDSIVFISADPENSAQNDDDRDGMHEMFAERGLEFAERHVIDRRTDAAEAVKLVREADCIWLMGGESTRQLQLIRDLGLDTEIRESKAVILGVSAGSMNLGRTVAYIWDDPYFYEALGLTNITIKSHYEEGEWFVPRLLEMSKTHPIVAMEDLSAIFVKGDDVWKVGEMYLVDNGVIGPITDEKLKELCNMFDIIELTEEQSEELNEALEEFDTEYITYRMEGSICLGMQKDGELIAGVNAYVTCFRILYIETLFVQDGYRRAGLGKQLITELERRAKEMGVNLIRVDTFDWQGKDFYLAMGYELAGQYTCEEDGYSEYFFLKRI